MDIHAWQDTNMKTPPTKSDLRTTLARKLRWYMDRYEHVDRQEKVAKRAGISQSSVNRVLAAKIDTQMRIVESLAYAIGVSPMELLTDEENDAAVIHYDRVRFARLPDADKRAIERYIEFVLSQADVATLDDDGSKTIEETIPATAASKRRAQTASQRPLPNESMSDGEEQNRSKRSRGAKTGA
ncbi:helix-turn-helix domain-containing protein [Burkholderia sp. 22PA0099]|uniref:helix-turn-helix domain-containing protein n=1 Tax=Burkholderia sp. 22PA0099 TaxID=3237372 RepID=UPI0039C07951